MKRIIADILDGPARGNHFTIGRAPILLRITYSAARLFDVLDQLDDTPRQDEVVWVYRMTGAGGPCFVDYSGPGGRRCGECVSSCTYAILPEQPEDGTLRDNQAWRAWCDANQDRLMPDWARGRAVMP